MNPFRSLQQRWKRDRLSPLGATVLYLRRRLQDSQAVLHEQNQLIQVQSHALKRLQAALQAAQLERERWRQIAHRQTRELQRCAPTTTAPQGPQLPKVPKP